MSRGGSSFNRQIAEEAAEWFVDFSAGDVDAEQLAKFNRWLRTSPQHVRAYLQLTAFWEEAELLKRRPEELEALAQQLARNGNVVPLRTAADKVEAAPASEIQRELPRQPRRRRFAIAAGIALLGIVTGTTYWSQRDRGVTYATQTGEHRSVTLEDGSIVRLNSRSRVRVDFDDKVRRVELLEGQALFDVAKNAARPFLVASGETSVRAVGTQFDVYRKVDGVVVTVLEGKVAVTTADRHRPAAGSTAAPDAQGDDEAPLLLSAGEQVVVTTAAILAPHRADVAVATAWTENKLVFDAAPLSEVAAEFNRYNRRRLVIDDPALVDVHISGVFSSTSVDHLVEFLQQRFPVVATQQEDEIRISRRP